MPAAVTAHSHRATTKVNNKAFKSRKATKGAMRDQLKGKMSHPGEHSLEVGGLGDMRLKLADLIPWPLSNLRNKYKRSVR